MSWSMHLCNITNRTITTVATIDNIVLDLTSLGIELIPLTSKNSDIKVRLLFCLHKVHYT